MKTVVENPELVDTFELDNRGRVRLNLGTKFANEEVRVAVELSDE